MLPRMLFLDVETTGLDPHKHKLLEVGAIMTDENLGEVFTFSQIVEYTDGELSAAWQLMNDYVRGMHTKSGLWDELKAREVVVPFQGIDHNLVHFLRQAEVTEKAPIILAGSSVAGFDRDWMRVWLEETTKLVFRAGARAYDLSTLRTHYDLRGGAEGEHRALADCLRDLELARRCYTDREEIYEIYRGLVAHEQLDSLSDFPSRPVVEVLEYFERVWGFGEKL